MLTQAQVEQYQRDGFIFPLRVMSEAAARACRTRIEDFERSTGSPLSGEYRHKSHLLFA